MRFMYSKIFTKILDSSIWLESNPTRIVWLTFLAAMDETGFAQFASTLNVAHRARVTDEEAIAAIKCLCSPDPNSSDPDNEGRRLERVPGGWIVLNAIKYRNIVSRAVAQEKTRIRVTAWRERNKLPCNAPVTPCTLSLRSETPSEAYTEAAKDTENPKPINCSHPKPPESELAPFLREHKISRRRAKLYFNMDSNFQSFPTNTDGSTPQPHDWRAGLLSFNKSQLSN